MTILSRLTPRVSAAICASTVSAPPPTSAAPVCRKNEPSSFIFRKAEAQSIPAIPLPCMVQAMPTPRFKWPAAGNALCLLVQPMAAAARSRHSGRPQLRTSRAPPPPSSAGVGGGRCVPPLLYYFLAVKLDRVYPQLIRDFVHQGFL